MTEHFAITLHHSEHRKKRRDGTKKGGPADCLIIQHPDGAIVSRKHIGRTMTPAEAAAKTLEVCQDWLNRPVERPIECHVVRVEDVLL